MAEHQQSQNKDTKPTDKQSSSVDGQYEAVSYSDDLTYILRRAEENPDTLSLQDVMQLQRKIGNQAVLQLLGRGRSSPSTVPMRPIQRADEPAPDPSTDKPNEPGKRPGALIVPDDAVEIGDGQMKRSEFLKQLEPAATDAAKQALVGTLIEKMGYPGIDSMLADYKGKGSSELENTIKQQVPGSTGATAAADYIPLIAQHVRSSVTEWVATGNSVETLTSTATDAVSDTVDTIGGWIGFKLTHGADAPSDVNPAAVSRQLGDGQSLEPSVKSQMEGAFGTSFSDVQVHTDSKAAKISDDLDARALTVGNTIAFGSGEYNPGTPMGDALIAHELAHVTQQRNASQVVSPKQQTVNRYDSVEEDADRSAVGAIAAIYGGARDVFSRISRDALPMMRSGLQLRACKTEEQKRIEELGRIQYDYLEQKRKEAEAEKKKKLEEEAKKKGIDPPKEAPKVTIDDVVKEESENNTLTPSKNDPWTALGAEGQKHWKTVRAPEAWKKLIDSIKGTELEKVMKGKGGIFKPEEILKQGAYAHQDGNNLGYGMQFVKDVEADPKNGWPIVAHEMGGHFEYGDTYAWKVYHQVKQHMSEDERKRLESKDQIIKDSYTYSYPETEIYAALRQRRYHYPEDPKQKKPTYGAIDPDSNIQIRLNVIKKAYDPVLAKAVLKHLKEKIDANPEILERDKKYFLAQVKKVNGIDL